MFEKYKSYQTKIEFPVLVLCNLDGFGTKNGFPGTSRTIHREANKTEIFMVLEEYIQDCGPGDLYWYKILYDARFYVICVGPNEIEDFDILFEEIVML